MATIKLLPGHYQHRECADVAAESWLRPVREAARMRSSTRQHVLEVV